MKIYSWITNVGETFLTQHRDMGVDIAYVSDYVDNHQQMNSDLKENEEDFKNVLRITENILKKCDTEEQRTQIKKNVEQMEQKWNRLKRTVEQRIIVSSDYLQFVKLLNQFRNSALDLQELFKKLNDHTHMLSSTSSDSVLEHHVQEKMQSFESLYREVIKQGQKSIHILRNVSKSCVKNCEMMFEISKIIFLLNRLTMKS